MGGAKGYGELRARGGALFWTESRPEEAGRTTLVMRTADSVGELTPAPLNPRSRVHEYGGGSYCVADEHVYFVNNGDQNVYEVPLIRDGPITPRQVTRGDASERFADLAWDGFQLLAVRERHADDGTEPVNDLVRIDVGDGAPTVLHAGHDFYAAPRPSGDGRLAFLVWDHPNMPFDGCQLLVAEYHGEQLRNATVVAGGAKESIVQPEWNGDRLLFLSDLEGYWNLYAHDGSGVYAVLPDAAEYGGPAWHFGNTYYVPVGPDHVVARRVDNGVPSLVLVDLGQALASPLDDASSTYTDVVRTPNGVAYIAGHAERPRRIVELRLDTRSRTTIAEPGEPPVGAAFIATPEALTFAAPLGDAHAFYYPPTNGDHSVPDDELPPLLVTTHGGPTSNAWADLDWRIQYYTSRGWAVADVNYGGRHRLRPCLPGKAGRNLGRDRCPTTAWRACVT